MKYFDVAVVGAGPIGLTAANIIAKSGFSVCVLERRVKIGYPSHCSGLVSARFIEENSVKPELVLNTIKGAYLFADEELLSFKSEESRAFVIDREKFDQSLAEEAQKSGAAIFTNSAVVSAKKHRTYNELYLQNGKTIKARFVIIASGAKSGVNRMFGFKDEESEVIYTAQTDLKVSLPDHESVYMYVDDSFAHNWFAWIIPIGRGLAHIGLGMDQTENIVDDLKRFICSSKLTKGVNVENLKPVGWIIPIGYAKKIVNGRVLRVGDAALQIKPFSGGGLYTGMKAARFAAGAVVKALKTDDVSVLNEYKTNVDREITPIVKRGLLLRRIYRSMKDRDKALFLKGLNNEEAKRIITESGDIDSPFFVGVKLLRFIGAPLMRYFKDLLVGINA